MITKINTIILIVLALFFPQMPLVHGVDSVSISHCSDGKMHHESQESSDHNMSLCVDIIRNIDKGITDDPFIFPDFVPPVFFSFWENTTKNLGPKYEISIYKTDPPHFSSQHLVWIIKLTI